MSHLALQLSFVCYKLKKFNNCLIIFFVRQSGRKEINAQLKKEADYFGDIVIVPYVDNYDLVVLKTVAICEYGVSD